MCINGAKCVIEVGEFVNNKDDVLGLTCSFRLFDV